MSKFSEEHYDYLKKKKAKKIVVLACQILIAFVFIFTWELLSKYNVINSFIFSSPSLAIKTILNLHNSNNLYPHILTTTTEILIAFALSSLIGFLVATLLWWYNTFAKIVDPYLTMLNSLPKVALGPIIIIWGGTNIKAIIIMALLISLIISIINIYEGFMNVDGNRIKLLKSFKATKLQIFFRCILPSSMINILNALKINISMSLIGVIMGEFLVSKSGIGYLIIYGSQVFNLNLVIAGICILAILSIILYYLISYLEKKIIKNIRV